MKRTPGELAGLVVLAAIPLAVAVLSAASYLRGGGLPAAMAAGAGLLGAVAAVATIGWEPQ